MDRRSFLRSLAALPALFFFGTERAEAAPKPKDTRMTWYGWGANVRGCAGLGDLAVHASGPVAQPIGIEFVQMSTSGPHVAAIDATGNLYVWGDNQYYRLGTGEGEFITPHSTPVLITQTEVHNIVEVACTFRGTFARRNDGHILYAGRNAQGENGEGAGAVGASYATYTDLVNWGTHAVTRMFGGGSAIAMLLVNGELWYSGANGSGEAADGTTTDVHTPQQWGGFSDVVDCTEPGSMVVLRSTGQLYAAGYNNYGELMDGTTTARNTPTLCTTGPANPARVFMAGETTYVIDTSGNLWAAGDNSDSQVTNSGVGDGSAHTSAAQIIISGKTFKSVLQSRAVDNYALLTTNGELWALGANTLADGKPIDNSGFNRFAYTRVWALSGIVEAHSPGTSEDVFLARVQPRRGRSWSMVIG